MTVITIARAIANLQGIKDDCDAGSGPAIVRSYDGPVPTNLRSAVTGSNTLLSELDMADPSFAAPVDLNPNASMTANTISDETPAVASGTPTFVRIFDSDLNPVLQLPAGVGSGEANFSDACVLGRGVRITSIVVTHSEA